MWEQANGIELEPLELSVVPGGGAGLEANKVAAAAAALEGRLTPKSPDYNSGDEGGIKDVDTEDLLSGSEDEL